MGLFSKGKVGMNPGRPPRGNRGATRPQVRALTKMFVALDSFKEYMDETDENAETDLALAPGDIGQVVVGFIQSPTAENLGHVAEAINTVFSVHANGYDTPYGDIEEQAVSLGVALYDMAEEWGFDAVKKKCRWVEEYY